jgi:hypothetical protein
MVLSSLPWSTWSSLPELMEKLMLYTRVLPPTLNAEVTLTDGKLVLEVLKSGKRAVVVTVSSSAGMPVSEVSVRSPYEARLTKEEKEVLATFVNIVLDAVYSRVGNIAGVVLHKAFASVIIEGIDEE